MKRLALGVMCLGAFAAILAIGFWHSAPPPPPSPAAPSPALSRGESLEREGKFGEAIDVFVAEKNADGALRAWSEALKPSADVAALAPRLPALDAMGASREAKSFAKELLKRDPECEAAHRFLGDEKIEGRWVDKDEVEIARVWIAHKALDREYDEASPRGKRVFLFKQELRTDSQTPLVFRDCAPDSPWFLAVENDAADPQRTLDRAAVLLKELNEEFFERFRGVPAISSDQMLPAVFFASLERYRRGVDPTWHGHLDTSNGKIRMPAVTEGFDDTLVSLATEQLARALILQNSKEEKSPSFWLTSGLGSWFRYAAIAASGSRSPGGPAPDFIAVLRAAQKRKSALVDLQELLDLTWARYAQQTSNADQKRLELRAQAWAFVMFLEDSDRHALLQKFLVREIEGKGGLDGAKLVFGDLKTLNTEYMESIRNRAPLEPK